MWKSSEKLFEKLECPAGTCCTLPFCLYGIHNVNKSIKNRKKLKLKNTNNNENSKGENKRTHSQIIENENEDKMKTKELKKDVSDVKEENLNNLQNTQSLIDNGQDEIQEVDIPEVPKNVVPYAPAVYATRMYTIKKLVEKIKKEFPDLKIPVKIAVQLEYNIASTVKSKQSYLVGAGSLLKNPSQEVIKTWNIIKEKNQIMANLNKPVSNNTKKIVIKPYKSLDISKFSFTDNLSNISSTLLSADSKNAHITIAKALESMIHPIKILQDNGFIVKDPLEDKCIDSNLDINSIIRTCDLCQTKFTISRNKDIVCRFHSKRAERQRKVKTNAMKGRGSYLRAKYDDTFIHPCCGEVKGNTPGCKKNTKHVYIEEDLIRKAQMIPFVKTPPLSENEDENKDIQGCIGIDCEMSYTSLGMEVVRVTVTSVPFGDILLDEIVKPAGEIWYYNTEYSGISEKELTVSNKKYDNLDSIRKKIFKFVGPKTIVIGHGLDSDFSALRWIHENIVDSAILYPHPRGLPYKRALKNLAWEFLSQRIQGGEHDSTDDSRTAVDLVLLKMRNKLAEDSNKTKKPAA